MPRKKDKTHAAVEKGKRVSASNPTTSVAYKEESNAKLTKGQAKIVL